MKFKITLLFVTLLMGACASNSNRSTASKPSLVKDALVKTSLNEKKTELLIVYPPGKNLSLKLNLPEDFSYESHSTRTFGDILFVTYEYSAVSMAGSEVVAIDKKKNKELWRRKVSSFNVSISLVSGKHVYISAMGQFSKLNLKTGKQEWHNENLIGEREVSGVEEVKKNGDVIELNDKVQFSDKTGNLLSMGGQ